MKIVKDEKALVRIFQTVSWLDSLRWNPMNSIDFIRFYGNDFTNSQKILTHWITYITDRQMAFEYVWDKGSFIFSEIVYHYQGSKLSPEQILGKHYEKYINKEKEEHFMFKSSDGKSKFASRYITDDYQNIQQTLEILDREYQRDIVVYIVTLLRRFQESPDLLIRVACGLYLLTYRLTDKKADPEEALKTINDDEQFERELTKFKKTSTDGKKRLWCCIRDYRKGLYSEVFNEAIKERAPNDSAKLIRLWAELPNDQMDLPGDVWNNSELFRDYLISNVIDIAGIRKPLTMPKIIRQAYMELKYSQSIKCFYPEQFDFTFDFVPRMCNKKLCDVCFFGKYGVEKVCIPQEGTQDKYCPVALISCGYRSKCDAKGCVVKDNISRGLCKSRL